MKLNVRIKSADELGLSDERVYPFEDGIRTEAKRGSYEWWYFDSKFPDGSSLVIVFFTKAVTSLKAKLEPYVSLDYVDPCGEEIHTVASSRDFSFAKDGCDIRIGECYARGDLKEYEIYFKNEVAEARLKLTATVPAWRPYSGHLYFGEKNYFAWLPSVPEGRISGTLRSEKGEKQLEGTGYHDHNFGNKLMIFLMNDWYWGRARVGDYVIVSSYIYANKKGGHTPTPIFMLAKDGRILADNAYKYLEYKESDFYRDPYTKRYVARTLVYDYRDPEAHYRITYRKGDEDIDRKVMRDIVGGPMAALFYALGFRGCYHRMGGLCTVERLINGEVAESYTEPAMWEQMCFRKDRVKRADASN